MPNKKIIIAENSGFCFGVKRAVDAISNALENNSHVWTIGLPIHNPQEVERLKNMGLMVADNANEIPDGEKVFIRAHGESLSVIENLKARNIKVIDMTCPFVKKAQGISQKNYHVILLGDRNHPEIKGIIGHCSQSVEVVANEAEAENITHQNRIALISQTTQQEEMLSKVSSVLVKKCSELHICNTICRATAERQNAVKELVKKGVDGVILIGGKSSANTGKLRDIIFNAGVNVLWVEDVKEFEAQKNSWLENKNLIGIAAGASTPEWLIIDVVNAVTRGIDSYESAGRKN